MKIGNIMKAVNVIHEGNKVYMDVKDKGVIMSVHRSLNDYGNHYWRLDDFPECHIAGFRRNRQYERAYRLYIKRNDIKPKDKAPKHWGIELNNTH